MEAIQDMPAFLHGARERAVSGGDAAAPRIDAATVFNDHWKVMAQAERLLAASRQHSGTIAAEIAAARQQLRASRAALERSAATTALGAPLPDDPAVAPLEAQPTAAAPAETQRTFAAVTKLVAEIERTAASTAEPIDNLIVLMKHVLASEADPSIFIGVLVEGIAQAIRQLTPAAEQLDLLVAALAMLRDRTLTPGGEGGRG